MKNFVYLIGAKDAEEVAVIDCAWDVEAVLQCAQAHGKKIVASLVSHHHGDHTNGLAPLLQHLDIPVYVQHTESRFAQRIFQPVQSALRPLKPGDIVSVGPLEVACIHTPGHTPGSQCFLSRGHLFSGDTVFVNACGRCDFPGGDARKMHDSLHRVLGQLPNETVLLPGHDYGDVKVSTLLREKQFNPYFQLKDEHDFVNRRMGLA
jgi:hydroxyacylglutathione hydrolase